MGQNQSNLILQTLKDRPGSCAREIAAVLKMADVNKKQINATLYRAEVEGLVNRSDETPPRWTHAESVQPDHTSAAEWIIDLYLGRSGEHWTDAEKRAASEGPNVRALQEFSSEELIEALDRAHGHPSLWSAWLTHARRIRAGSIHL